MMRDQAALRCLLSSAEVESDCKEGTGNLSIGQETEVGGLLPADVGVTKRLRIALAIVLMHSQLHNNTRNKH